MENVKTMVRELLLMDESVESVDVEDVRMMLLMMKTVENTKTMGKELLLDVR